MRDAFGFTYNIHKMNDRVKNFQILATETGSATDILNEVLPLKPPSNYNLRN